MRALLLLALVACVASFDCDTLAEPERTRCLDRAADQNIQMVPVDEDIVPVAKPAQEEASYDDDDSDTDDIMGDLGEGAKTEAKASATAAAKEDEKLAEASTAGLYDDDVKVAKAFSDLADQMDDLKMHVGQLKMKTRVAQRVKEVKEEYAREEASEESSSELGESDNTEAKKESFGILDATADDLDQDLTVKYHPEPKPDDNAVDDILGKMHAEVHDKNPLDYATELIQYQAANEDVDPAVTNDMVLQDLASSQSSLVERANLEAQQSDAMDDEQDLQSQANDLGEAAESSEAAGDLDAVTSTLIDHPHLSLDNHETQKQEAADVVSQDEGGAKSLGDVGALDQDHAVDEAAAFANDEDRNEEAIIQNAEQHEQEMEKAAQKDMIRDEKAMKDLDAQTNKDILNANKVH